MSLVNPSPAVPKPASGVLAAAGRLLWDWLACFRSVHLAIVLLSLLIVGILIGVFMPQDGLVETADIKDRFGSQYRLYKAMGLFNVYSSYWFITIQVLFFFNLLLGSFQWLRPAFLSATQTTFLTASQITKAKQALVFQAPEALYDQSCTHVETLLRRFGYRVHRQSGNSPEASPEASKDTVCLYATKGNFSRFGPYLAHVGILMLIVSSLYGTFYGFKAQKLAVPGQTFSLNEADTFMPNVQQGLWRGSIPDMQVSVTDFQVQMYPERPEVVKQYYASLVVTPPDEAIYRKTISVNDPFVWRDVSIYQASFLPTGKLFFALNGKPVEFNANSQFQDRSISVYPLDDKRSLVVFPFFVKQDPGVSENYAVIFMRDRTGGFVGGAPGKMPDNLRLRQGESGTLGGMHVQYVRPEFATGLQIKQAPEVPFVYASYLIICLGTILCIFSQRQLWVSICQRPDATEIALLPHTNKAKVSFSKELLQLRLKLEALLPNAPMRPEPGPP